MRRLALSLLLLIGCASLAPSSAGAGGHHFSFGHGYSSYGFRGWDHHYPNGFSHEGWYYWDGHWYKQKEVVKPVFFPVATFVPLPLFAVSPESVLKPQVATVAAPAQAQAGPSSEMAQVVELIRDVKGMLHDHGSRISAIEAHIGLTPLRAPARAKAAPARGQTLLRGRCASCHTPEGAKKGGHEHVYFDAAGQLTAGVGQAARMARAVERGSMPEAPVELGPGEKDELLAYLRSLAPAQPAKE